MAKTLFITLILCLMMIASTWGEEGGVDGYVWEQMSEDAKFYFMAGFLKGNMTGYSNGQASAGKIGKEMVQYQYRKNTVAPSYYVKEVDAFLQTYSLCKKQDLFITISGLTLVWFEIPNIKQATYKKISEDWCE